MFWALGTILTNSYVLYCSCCDLEEVERTYRLSHYEFLEEVGLYWVNPELMEKEQQVCGTKRKASPMSPSTASTITDSFGSPRSTTTSDSNKRPKFTNESLPPTGAFGQRLLHDMSHLLDNCAERTESGEPVKPKCACMVG